MSNPHDPGSGGHGEQPPRYSNVPMPDRSGVSDVPLVPQGYDAYPDGSLGDDGGAPDVDDVIHFDDAEFADLARRTMPGWLDDPDDTLTARGSARSHEGTSRAAAAPMSSPSRGAQVRAQRERREDLAYDRYRGTRILGRASFILNLPYRAALLLSSPYNAWRASHHTKKAAEHEKRAKAANRLAEIKEEAAERESDEGRGFSAFRYGANYVWASARGEYNDRLARWHKGKAEHIGATAMAGWLVINFRGHSRAKARHQAWRRPFAP